MSQESESVEESNEKKVKCGVECCGTVTFIWIIPSGPEKLNCLVWGNNILLGLN